MVLRWSFISLLFQCQGVLPQRLGTPSLATCDDTVAQDCVDEGLQVTMLQRSQTHHGAKLLGGHQYRGRIHPIRAAIMTLAKVDQAMLMGLFQLGMASLSCSWISWVVPALCISLLVVCSSYVGAREYFDHPGRTAVFLNITQIFLQNCTYTMVIPTSYDLAESVGQGEAFSGIVISAHQVGVCFGSICMWAMLQLKPGLWNDGLKPWLLMCFAGSANFIGALSFSALVAVEAGHSTELSWLAIPLLICRFVDGFGTGISLQFTMIQIIHCIPSSERPQWMATSQFAVMLGTGCGPLLSSLTATINQCSGPQAAFAGLGSAYVGVGSALLLSMLILYPRSFQEVRDEQGSAAEACEDAVRICSFDVRVLMAVVFLAMTALRGFVISGLEAATSLLLEESYGWDPVAIGYAIGVCFLFSGPVKVIYNIFRDRLSTQSWIRLYTMTAIFAALLLFSKSCTLLGGALAECSGTLLAADAVMFPTLFLADALAAGSIVASDYILPADSWFAPNMLMLYRAIFVFGIGRVSASPLARLIIEEGGRNAYAVLQIISTVAWLILFEMFDYLATVKKLNGKAAPLEQGAKLDGK